MIKHLTKNSDLSDAALFYVSLGMVGVVLLGLQFVR